MPRGTGREIYPLHDGKKTVIWAFFRVKTGFFPVTNKCRVPLGGPYQVPSFVKEEVQQPNQTPAWVPRGTGRESYPSRDGNNPSFGRVFPSMTGFFPSQTNVQSLWVGCACFPHTTCKTRENTRNPEGMDLKFSCQMTAKTPSFATT